jgi:biopolymer transport protein TolR
MAGFIQGNNSSRSSSRSKRIISDINVTPLVDVMLVLLIVFMVTSPMLVSGINIDLPKTSANPFTGKDEPLTITVDKKGVVYLHDYEIKESELADKLVAITNEKYDTRIFVRGDKAIDYGQVMKIVGLISTAGFKKISLVTELQSDS